MDGPGRGRLSPGPTDPSPTGSHPRSHTSPTQAGPPSPNHPSPRSRPQASKSLSGPLRKGGGGSHNLAPVPKWNSLAKHLLNARGWGKGTQ